jgi:DNA-binding GntR family transcriptional regulator
MPPAMLLPEAGISRFRTKQEFVYRTLRDAIMRCTLAPGERLVIDDLSRKLSVSAIPIREALQLLQSEGLVLNVPHVGATVTPISRESVEEVFAVMEGLEIVGAREAALRMTAQDAEVLRGIVAEMDGCLAAGRFDDWAHRNVHFHLSICRMSGMPMLYDMAERAMNSWSRLRHYYFHEVLLPRVTQAQREHHGLLSALTGGNLEVLEERVKRHNRGAFDAYTSYLREHGSP